jgi:diadenosine tetraphosphate (Ap4A) HIT family hydrolase
MDGCLACDLAEGRLPLPGGRIHETTHWLVEHCVGPLAVGTLIVKPRRHVTRVADLGRDESDELGGVLRAAAAAVEALMRPEQVYVTLWSHSDATPQHIHWVIQPVTREVMADHDGLYGPRLQVAMFERGAPLSPGDVEAAAARLRSWFAKERP